MDTGSRPKSRTREAANMRERIQKGLQDLRGRFPDGKIYVSRNDLLEWVTPDAVGKWITASRIEEVDKLHLKNRICSSALKTFCVLLEIEKENAIRYFVERADPKHGADRVLFTVAEDVQRFLRQLPRGSGSWTQAKCQEFCEKRRKYVAARLSYGGSRHLEDKEILPFQKVEFFEGRGEAVLCKVVFDGRFLIDKLGKPYSKNMIQMMRKELPLNLAEKEQHLIRYLQVRQDQPNQHLIKLYAYYTQKQKGYLLMPLLQGDLRGLLMENAQEEYFRSDERYLGEMLSLAKALCSMHTIDEGLYNETIVHHDLKPANVLLDHGKFVLSDFGIGRMRCPTVSPDQESYGNSSWWLAPETTWKDSWRGIAGPKSDVFSLGCIFLELLVHMRGGKDAVSDFRMRRSVHHSREAARFWGFEGNDQPRISTVVLSELGDIMQDAEHPKRARVAGVVLQMVAMEIHFRLSAGEVVTKLRDVLEEPESESISIVRDNNEKADGLLIDQSPAQEIWDKDQGTGAKMPSSTVGRPSSTLDEPSRDGVTDTTSEMTLNVPEAKLGQGCDHESDSEIFRRTKNLTVLLQGRVKSHWKTEPYITPWAGKATSSVLFLYSDSNNDEEVISYLSTRIIKSAEADRPSDDITGLRHFCKQDSKNGDLAVYRMMQSLRRHADVPDRIRIRSTFLLDLLSRITRVKLHYGGRMGSVEERTSLVFLYPFKFFVTFANEIKAEADRLKTKFGRDSQSEQLRTPTSPNDVANDAYVHGTMEEDYDSEKAFEYLTLVAEFMDKYLQPIFDLRESYRNATHDTVFFQDLWLLFEKGSLLFQREPLPDHPPHISRLIHCNGGPRLLKNSDFKSQETRRDIPGAPSKGMENQFCLHHYHLDFDGELYGPKGDRLTIPAWEGERSVYDLKIYPLAFVRNHKDHSFESLNDYKSHLVKRGKGFVELDAIDHRYYSGEVIGTHHEYYSSSVVIDFKLQMRDTAPQSGLLAWKDTLLKSESDLDTGLSIYPGDPREVQEGTLRANSTEECNFPGCDGNDFIHDDIHLDDIVAHRKLIEYGRTSAKFQRSDLRDLTEADYMLFPSYVHGYFLNNRAWVKLHLDSLKAIPKFGSNKFDVLHIPPEHKTYLKALVCMCDKNSPNSLALDIIPGKGQGVIILLHGGPGVGKTATAEAVAADMGRPLYPITYADLGHDASTAETNLKRIFRLGQRWNCVLLLDEADVFLMERDTHSTNQNGIVSVFLRNLEWYPGLIFMTTNSLARFGFAILDRIHIKLRYPSLSEPYTENIFNDHFERINQANQTVQGLSMDKRGSVSMKYVVSNENMAAIQKWRKDQYAKARSAGSHHWWNGRQIRAAFQMAAALARQDMIENDGWTAHIKKSHFEKIVELHDAFNADLVNAQNDQPDKPDKTEQV